MIRSGWMRVVGIAALGLWGAIGFVPAVRAGDKPMLESVAVFPAEDIHNHASCIIECQNGDLFVTWYRGHGERTSDDVQIFGARWPKGGSGWGPRWVIADTPGYPDCNPAAFSAPNGDTWIFWPTILDHHWEGALLKYAVAHKSGPFPNTRETWQKEGVLHVTPKGFAEDMAKELAKIDRKTTKFPVKLIDEAEARSKQEIYQRLGWMPRVHPIVLPSGRWVLPLYTDTFSVSIMAITDDHGKTWHASRPLIGWGNIQPALVRKKDGTIVAYMRENGPTDKIRVSSSKDDGETWSPVESTEFPNPGAGVDAINMTNGHWALIYNDREKGRHTLAVSISDDEGKTWKWTRHLENGAPDSGSYHYPSLMQAKDGSLHASYTHRPKGKGSTIQHAKFNEAWVMEADRK